VARLPLPVLPLRGAAEPAPGAFRAASVRPPLLRFSVLNLLDVFRLM